MTETIERIGVCNSKRTGAPAIFHRLKIKLSRKYRVWPVAGDYRSMDLDPAEYMSRYTTAEAFAPQKGTTS